MEKAKDNKKEEMENQYVSAVTIYSDNISGICSFIEVPNENEKDEDKSKLLCNVEQRIFILLNFRGIYNLNLMTGLIF